MWVEALQLFFEKLSRSSIDLRAIAAISGAGQVREIEEERRRRGLGFRIRIRMRIRRMRRRGSLSYCPEFSTNWRFSPHFAATWISVLETGCWRSPALLSHVE